MGASLYFANAMFICLRVENPHIKFSVASAFFFSFFLYFLRTYHRIGEKNAYAYNDIRETKFRLYFSSTVSKALDWHLFGSRLFIYF